MDLAPDRILQTGFAFWGSKTLLSAIELGLFTELAKGPADCESLTARLNLNPRSTRDFFDALVALGMLDRTAGVYANTPETAQYLDRAKPTYLGGMLEMANARLYPFWGRLTEGLRTGKPQNEIQSGENLFEAIYSNPAQLRQFLSAMTGFTLPTARAVAARFPWKDYRTFVDVGGAQGAVPVQVALANEHLTGASFDLPTVGPVFDEYVASFGLNGRLRFVGGSFFTDPLPKADVVIMGRILHDWDLAEKRMLIAKAYEALPEGGAFVVIEMLIDDERRRNLMGMLKSLNMLIETQGGFDFTGADCCGWMSEAGFRQTRVEHLAGVDYMAIGIK